MNDNHEHFRAGVGAWVTNERGQVLAFRRMDVRPDSWQLPQGGIRRGEDPPDALRRELAEEAGLWPEDYEVVGAVPEWLAYELPEACRSRKTGRGQAQKWFLCRILGDASRIRPDRVEFDAWQWMEPEELLRQTVDFRKPVYRRLLDVFGGRR